MALIVCEDCGKHISNKVSVCPYCGCPQYYEEETPHIAPKKKLRVNNIIICVILFFVCFNLGRSLFPNAVHNENASFVPIALAILSGIYIACGLTMAMWKRILLGFIPHFFSTFMILLSMSGGYLLGCIAGM